MTSASTEATVSFSFDTSRWGLSTIFDQSFFSGYLIMFIIPYLYCLQFTVYGLQMNTLQAILYAILYDCYC